MKALTVLPGKADSLELTDWPEPTPGPDELLVEGIAVGVCGTDREIVSGAYGWAPPDQDRLVIGHESLGRVRTAPDGSGFAPGDHVVGVVRRPDPEPCGACAHGEFDMCRNGRYTERGIKEMDGYAAQLWTVETGYAVKVDPALGLMGVLLEPTTVVAKAWEEVERIGQRAWFSPRTALITGAGPIGLLAALLGKQRGLQVHVLDRVTEGLKPQLVADLGADYHTGSVAELAETLRPDVIIEATGVGQVVFDSISATGSYGILCLTGVSSGGHVISADAGSLNRGIVLENDVIVGSVNANLRHYAAGAKALAVADHDWLGRLLTKRVPVGDYATAYAAPTGDVKIVLELEEAR
jgi:threonine dehydrogenase-like Zn-dependent dehydrogenase